MKQPKIVTMYEADDGTKFESASECVAYEQRKRVEKLLHDNIDRISSFSDDYNCSEIDENLLIDFIIDNIRAIAEAVDPDIFEK